MKKGLFAVFLFIALLKTAQALDVSLFITKNGASSDFSATTPRWWNFTITDAGAAAGLVVVNGNFTIVKEPQAVDPITFSFYSGFIYNGTASGNNTLLASASRPATDFSGGGGTAQLFSFSVPPAALSAGAYGITLTTTAPNSPNKAFKTWTSTEQIQLQDTSGSVLSAT